MARSSSRLLPLASCIAVTGVVSEGFEGQEMSGGLYSNVSSAFSFFEPDISLRLLFSGTSIRVGEELCMVFRRFEEGGCDL